MEEIKNLVEQGNAKSQSEFVSDAIRFYVGYLQQGKNVDYLAPIISQTIKEEIHSTEKNICQILFKLAVEQAIAMNVIAATCNISPEQLEKLRGTCVNQVKKSNGSYSFNDAYSLQKR